MRKTNNLTKWNEYFNKCLNQFPADIKILLDPSLTKEQVLTSLKQISSTQEDYKYLKSISDYRQKKQSNNYFKLFNDIRKTSNDGDKLVKPIYDQMKQKSYLDLILRLFFSIEVKNKKLVNSTLSELIKIPASYLTLDIENKIQFKDRKNFSKLYITYLGKLWDFQCDESLKKMFMQGQMDIGDELIQKEVGSLLGDFFVDLVKFDKKDYMYGISYPTYWLKKVEGDFSKNQFLQSYFQTPAKYKILPSEYGIIKYYFPKESKLRDRITKTIKSDFDKFENYEIEATLKAIENQAFKKYLGNIYSPFKKPTFTIKKNIYLAGLRQNKFGFYGFFELMKLGYEDKLFLWWLL
jgi:hypothetical protein